MANGQATPTATKKTQLSVLKKCGAAGSATSAIEAVATVPTDYIANNMGNVQMRDSNDPQWRDIGPDKNGHILREMNKVIWQGRHCQIVEVLKNQRVKLDCGDHVSTTELVLDEEIAKAYTR